MSLKTPDPLRDLAVSCLPASGRLYAHRGRALYAATGGDAARFEAAGFAAAPEGGALALSLTEALLPTLARALGNPGAQNEFAFLAGRPVSPAELALVTQAIKGFYHAKPDLTILEKQLRQTAAVCLRTGAGGALWMARAMLTVLVKEADL